MLGAFINRCLVLLLGYAYPAYLCYKTAEKRRVDAAELRFWCQYWVLVALVTVFESIGDLVISWVPLYGEAKVALFIYLWCPKTKGSGFMYDTVLQPYLSKHEEEIDRKLQELKGRAWDFVSNYMQNFTTQGQAKLFEMVHIFASQAFSAGKNNNNSNDQPKQKKDENGDKSGDNVNNLSRKDSFRNSSTEGDSNSPTGTDNLQEARLKLRRSKPID